MKRIYLDYAATTPVLPEVIDAMMPWLGQEYGNPNSMHQQGRKARAAIDISREVLSETLGSLFGEIIFTSSGTEAACIAIIGTALGNKNPNKNKILIGSSEHHCVLYTQEVLERLGYKVDLIPVDHTARIMLQSYQNMLDERVLLVSVMHANNELGTINCIFELSTLAHEAGAFFHTDAVQTFLAPLSQNKQSWSLKDLQIDLLSISAHKVYGPKGTGALYIKGGTPLKPLMKGGGQEREIRGGTENIAGIVGFATAIKFLRDQKNIWEKKWELRQKFLKTLKKLSDIEFNLTVPDFENMLAGHLHLRFNGLKAESLLIVLDRLGVSTSSGAACSSGSLEPSHVLQACQYSKEIAMEGIRLTFGLETSMSDAEEAAYRLIKATQQVANKIRN